jgi:signal transduction histidine kinase
MLDVARLRGGQLRFENAAVDLAEVTREVIHRLASDLARSGSTLSTRGPTRLVGCWDRERIEQIVCNLLSNAIRFGLGRPIEIELAADAAVATLTVRDHGIGIATDAQQRIFEPFERAVRPRHYGGLGLGLYVVRVIIDQMGGSIGVDSKLDQGATFVVHLPLGRPP